MYIDINPLLAWDSNAQISGWFPIYDTLQGVRGELHATIKLQFFGDINPFKDSSAGVQFYSTTTLPPNYYISSVLGFVSALETEEDPEYHWADNFRSPRKSNESRTLTMFRLSGNCRRELGKKAVELKGNAVLGVQQYFDLESGQRSITVRSIGTAVNIVKYGSTVDEYEGPFLSYSPPIHRSPPTFASPQKSLSIISPSLLPIEEPEPLFETVPALVLPSSHWRSVDPVFLTIKSFPKNAIIAMVTYALSRGDMSVQHQLKFWTVKKIVNHTGLNSETKLNHMQLNLTVILFWDIRNKLQSTMIFVFYFVVVQRHNWIFR